MEVGTKFVDTPRAIRVESHSKIVAHKNLVVVLQLVTEKAVDAIDREMLSPSISPFLAVITLNREDELTNGLWNFTNPGIVFFRVIGRLRQQLDDRAQRSLRT